MSTYFNDVNDWLSVGGDLDLARDVTGQDFPTTIAQLRAHGVTHVLDLRSEWTNAVDWLNAGLGARNYHHAPIIDSRSHIPSEDWFCQAEDFIRTFWMESADGDRLYVHCHMGINRAPSTAMLALLTVDPYMTPMDAFMAVRGARPEAGLVYAEAVGIRHLLAVEGVELELGDDLPTSVVLFSAAMRAYWTPELRQTVHRGIAYYRDREGGTLKVGGEAVLSCPANAAHRVKFNGGNPICMDCNRKPIAVDRALV